MSAEEQQGTIPFICGVESPLEIQYDRENDYSMGAAIVQAMVEETEVDAADVPRSFYECIDPDALDDLFRPQMSGTPRVNGELSFSFVGHYITVRSDDHITIESELGRLKRTGGNILLTGNIPEDVLNRVSAQFLGDSKFKRTSFFALYGRDTEIAQTRLSQARGPSDRAHIVTHESIARSAADVQSNQPSQLSVSTVTESLEEFQTTIQDQLFDLQQQRNGFDPAELRFCFDSIQHLMEKEGAESVERFLTAIMEAIEDMRGLGHYILSDEYNSRSVQTIQSKFDVTIELKIGERGPEQRWHLHDTEHTTKWFPV
ncbi:DUF7504 family protein [Haladaptatus sp. NG-WS-4]